MTEWVRKGWLLAYAHSVTVLSTGSEPRAGLPGAPSPIRAQGSGGIPAARSEDVTRVAIIYYSATGSVRSLAQAI
ncbi:hypothetical protein, partial [Actinacidiphila glaucinigra]